MELASPEYQIDFDHLFRLRLVVARHGEMDGARWWNTKGILGRNGGMLMSRGFPNTHRFAQARLVFEVARARSAERFLAVPGSITLWDLPATVEDEFDANWGNWLDNSASWAKFFDALQIIGDDLIATMRDRGLIKPQQESDVSRMRRSSEGRSVLLSGARSINNGTITLLAAGFARGEVGKPAIPYARMEG